MKICIFVGCSNQWQFNQLVRPIKSIKYKSDSTRPQNCNLINFSKVGCKRLDKFQFSKAYHVVKTANVVNTAVILSTH